MGKKLPKIITQEEFEKLYKKVGTLKLKTKNQYKLSMLLGFEAGLRISEVIGYKDKVPKLTKDNIDLQRNQIIIRSGKGGKDRVVPLPKRFTEKQLRLLPIKLSRRSLQAFVTKIGEDVLGRRISFHTLRHGFGSHLAGQGRPIHEIQLLLGHSRLDTTGIYLHANPKIATEGARDVF